MKQILNKFIDVLELAHLRRAHCGSAFEQRVAPAVLERADFALELALAGGQPLVLFTTPISAQALIAGLVLHRAGVQIANVYNANLDDDGFRRLAIWLTRINSAKLVFEAGLPATPESIARHLAGGRYVMCC